MLSDFDGTLAPIVEDPEAARPLPGVRDTLQALARRYQRVAVVSGRPVSYLTAHLGAPEGVVLVGLYGLEKGAANGVEILPAARRWRPAVDQVAAAAEREAPPGVYVERKGLSVGLHVRRAPQYAGWVEAWSEQQAAATGLVKHRGKQAVELVPPVATDKGRVVAELARGLTAVCYLGDDLGDVPAFVALHRLAASGVSTLAVAVRSSETPPELLAQADATVDGPPGALALLRRLQSDSRPA
ncbi:MAG TPA: trehalose-phosphatase [Acidimicrobiales bacterium]|nr:trehalose-phosphatase [Acidimicrobiales bacterium]